ncbi:hypothetical protein URH17368_2672 [Alicyclobacillus hesperidum URH17-3-68]|nr:hypothetical protein URH17368_2672 [Alicyclobacillus hesperidum URH17-3-68]
MVDKQRTVANRTIAIKKPLPTQAAANMETQGEWKGLSS